MNLYFIKISIILFGGVAGHTASSYIKNKKSNEKE